MKGMSESIKNICKRYGIQVHFKSGRTIKDQLVAPKDKNIQRRVSKDIWRGFKEHLKAPSPIYDHSNITGHTTTLENFSIVGREEQNLSRVIKESMFIRVNNSSLNSNIGKYNLPDIWDEVLINTTELKLKKK